LTIAAIASEQLVSCGFCHPACKYSGRSHDEARVISFSFEAYTYAESAPFMKNLFPSLTASLLACMTPLSAPMAQQTCSKQSPAHTVALVELYTSEGCSSCPPADKAVSALRQAAAQDLVVPLSMHVDYWDYIGWTDRFAKPEFTLRQYHLADEANSRAVYTPEIFLGTRELRSWSGSLDANISDVNRKPARASISIDASMPASGKLPVMVKTHSAQGGKLFIALYENGLSSNVKAGENSGVVLRHDFVVRDWLGPIALPSDGPGGNNAVARSLTVPVGVSAQHLGVAAFVQDAHGDVLQALALPLCAG
jgi:hypothetical protein